MFKQNEKVRYFILIKDKYFKEDYLTFIYSLRKNCVGQLFNCVLAEMGDGMRYECKF